MDRVFLNAYVEYISNNKLCFMEIWNCIQLTGVLKKEVNFALVNDIPIKTLNCYDQLIEVAKARFEIEMEEDLLFDFPNKHDFCFIEDEMMSVDEELYEACLHEYFKEYSYTDIVGIFIEDPGEWERFRRKYIGLNIGSMPDILDIYEHGYRNAKYIVKFSVTDRIIRDVELEIYTSEGGIWLNNEVYPDYKLICKYIDNLTDYK